MFSPRVFLSYSRDDSASADELSRVLHNHGCRVWMDRTAILVGDDFVRNLGSALDRQDALVLLLTETSARSSWCHAEVLRAISRNQLVAVVQRDENCDLPDAIDRLLRDIQRIPYSKAILDLSRQVQQARKRIRRRYLRYFGIAIIAALTVVTAALLAASKINRFEADRKVDAAVSALSEARQPLSNAEIRSRLSPAIESGRLTDALNFVITDPAASATGRFNAWQGLVVLRKSGKPEWRTAFRSVEWTGGRLEKSIWEGSTYQTGVIRDLSVSHMRIAGVSFSGSPDGLQTGMSILGSSFRDSDLWFVTFNGTQMIDVEFVNSKFRGSQLDLSNAAGVKFITRRKNDAYITPEVLVIEDSWIVQRRSLPEDNVLDLSTPEQELIFDGAQFSRVRFEGYFKPEWFKNSHFENCIFATDIDTSMLSKNGNTHFGTIFAP